MLKEALSSVTSSNAAAAQARAQGISARACQTGVWLLLAEIVMLFAAFTSAMVVRRGAANDWVQIVLPAIFQGSTLLLLIGSVLLEGMRRRVQRAAQNSGETRISILWPSATVLCGVGFLACQWLGFQQLAAQGVYLATNPASSFAYVFVATHSIHLLGGVIGTAYFGWRIAQTPPVDLARQKYAVDAAAIYWHGMTVLWIYILVVLRVGL